MKKYSILYQPKSIRHIVVYAKSKDDIVKKVNHMEQRFTVVSAQLEDGSIGKLEQLECDSLSFDDLSIELIED